MGDNNEKYHKKKKFKNISSWDVIFNQFLSY